MMKNKEIIEGNKLIAEFMGWDEYHKDKSYLINKKKDRKISFFVEFNMIVPIYEFNYHSSWDWLMPVIEKIETLSNPHTEYASSINTYIDGNNCDIYYTGYHAGTLIAIKDADNKINAVYQAVIEFIKWYNGKI